MTDKDMQGWDIGSFLNFGMKRAQAHWPKMLGVTVAMVVIGIAVPVLLGYLASHIATGFAVLVFLISGWLCFSALAFGYYKNILNLATERGFDFKAFFPESQPFLQFLIAGLCRFVAVVLGVLILLQITMWLAQLHYGLAALFFLLAVIALIPTLIIFMLMTSQVPWLIIDKKMTFLAAAKQSREMTNGYKTAIFTGFIVALLLLGLVTGIPCVGWILILFTMPMFIFIRSYPYLKFTDQLPVEQPKPASSAASMPPSEQRPPTSPAAPA